MSDKLVAWKVVCVRATNPRHGAMWHSHANAVCDAKRADGIDDWLVEGLTQSEVAMRLKSGYAFEDELIDAPKPAAGERTHDAE